MFRRAVWNYIQCIYGIRHDDYDYREVNELLDRDLKEYIKAVCCYPDRMTKEDYDNVMREFKYSEKVSVHFGFYRLTSTVHAGHGYLLQQGLIAKGTRNLNSEISVRPPT